MANESSPRLRLSRTSHPLLYEVNVRLLVNELSEEQGKRITLDTIPDSLLDEWARFGFDAIWLMGVWTPSDVGTKIAREHEGLPAEYRKALPDFTDNDVVGSPYAVKAYNVARSLGGEKALAILRSKLAKRGMGLVLDFVPNHTARDHVWLDTNPEYYIQGNDGEERTRPDFCFRTATKKGERTIAFGRDPYFPGWTDTAQLNIFHPQARKAMIETLLGIGSLCDGIRCDMAMLLLRQVFADTWGERARPQDVELATEEFWNDAIGRVKQAYPECLFVAESYWGLEWNLQRLGFDYTYDKVLHDRLLHEGAGSVRDHLRAEAEFQNHSARFIENHDEQRIAAALPNEAWQYAAALIALTVPGMALLHEGQLDGRRVKVPVQLGRRAKEAPSTSARTFYTRLLKCVNDEVLKKGEWFLLNHHPAWPGNQSFENFIAYWWRKGNSVRFVIINYAPMNSQCYVEMNLDDIEGASLEFADMLSPAVFVRDRAGLLNKGMYFDLPAYGMHFFKVKKSR